MSLCPSDSDVEHAPGNDERSFLMSQMPIIPIEVVCIVYLWAGDSLCPFLPEPLSQFSGTLEDDTSGPWVPFPSGFLLDLPDGKCPQESRVWEQRELRILVPWLSLHIWLLLGGSSLCRVPAIVLSRFWHTALSLPLQDSWWRQWSLLPQCFCPLFGCRNPAHTSAIFPSLNILQLNAFECAMISCWDPDPIKIPLGRIALYYYF